MKKSRGVDLIRSKSFAIFCIFISTLFSVTNFDIQPIQPSIDASYYYVYSSIFLGNFTSSSLALTYGPLGFIVHALDMHNMKLLLILIFLVFGVLLGLLVYTATKHIEGYKKYIAATAFVVVISIQVFEWKLLAAYLLLCIVAYYKKSRRLLYAISGMASLLMFVKLSLGILAFCCFAITVLMVDRRLKTTVRCALVFLGGIVLTGLILFRFSLHLFSGYFVNGIDVSAAYGSAMGIQPTDGLRTIVIIGSCVALGFLGIFLLLPKKDKPLILLGLLSSFFVWKAAVVRQDPYGHIESMAFFAAFIFFLYLFFIYSFRFKKINKLVIGMFIVLCSLISWGVYLNGYTISRFVRTAAYPATFWKIETCLLAPCVSSQPLKLQSEVRDMIGDKTVDVYPWEELIVEKNKLNWAPRPSPASYGTYAPRLDNLNAAFFGSSKAPEVLIWDTRAGVLSIDERHLFFDEPRTLQAILNSYELVGEMPPYFVLQKRSMPQQQKLLSTTDLKLQKDVWISVNPSVNSLVSINYASTAIEKAQDLVLRSDPVKIKVKRESGVEGTYRVVPKNLQQGIVVSQLPGNVSELIEVFKDQPIDDPVVAFSLVGHEAENLSVNIREYQLNQ